MQAKGLVRGVSIAARHPRMHVLCGAPTGTDQTRPAARRDNPAAPMQENQPPTTRPPNVGAVVVPRNIN